MANVKLGAAYGRLYVTGAESARVARCAGAAFNPRRRWYELALTLETLRGACNALGIEWEDLARHCNEDLMRWVRAATQSDAMVRTMHARIDSGYRVPLPWYGPEDKPPMEHQLVMATAACLVDGLAFVCQTGTSKTRPALEAAAYQLRERAVQHIIWVCPNGVVGTAEEQARLWLDGSIAIVPLVDMPVKEREAMLRTASLTRRPTIYILNLETLHKLAPAVVEVSKGTALGFVIDEMHVIRNPNTKMTQAALTVAQHARWRLGITGSPIIKGPEDLWSQWYVIDLGLTFGANVVQFRREYLVPSYSGFGWMPKPGTPERVGQMMLARSLRYTKDECLDLPPKLYETVRVVLSAEQRKAYRQMQETLVAQWTEAEELKRATAATQLASATRLSQITSGYVPLLDGALHHFSPNPRLETLEQLVRENINEQQIIVWAWYKENIAAIADRLKDIPLVKIVGGMTKTARDEAEDKFERGEARLLLGNTSSGGRGLNLQSASLAIYYSQRYGLEDRLQSEDRCHRKGSEQHAKVTYIDLVAEGTVDELVIKSNAERQSMADIIVDLQRHIGMEVSVGR